MPLRLIGFLLVNHVYRSQQLEGGRVAEFRVDLREGFKQAADLGDEISKQRYDEITAKMQLKKHDDVSVNSPAPQKKSALGAILDRGKQAQANDAAAKAAPEKTTPDISIGKGGGR